LFATAAPAPAPAPERDEGLVGVTHAITLWPEWAFAISRFGKDVENRGDGEHTVALHRFVGKRLAIHAGAYIGGRPGEAATRSGLNAMLETASRAHGHLVHVGAAGVTCRRIVATAGIGEPVTNHSSPWAVPGAWHFPLLDVRPAWSAPRNGALGVWRIE
jgi:hypothetical protein